MLLRSETQNNPAAERWLRQAGWQLAWWRCPCGACDVEEAWTSPGLSDDEEDEFLFNEEGELSVPTELLFLNRLPTTSRR